MSEFFKKSPKRRSQEKKEEGIKKELVIEKELIEDKRTPIRKYNYSYIREQLEKKGVEVSLPTIIRRAKELGYYRTEERQKAKHEREVISNYTGELIQHDSSHHLFAPLSQEKYYLITSIDDYSRYLIYAGLTKRESTVAHIKAVEQVFTMHGLPVAYYTDMHSIFHYIAARDENLLHQKRHIGTGEIYTQWGYVLKECNVENIPAGSPQAKGKIERPYSWLQDHLTRTCYREKVTTIEQAKEVLKEEVRTYNYKRIHYVTGEIPAYRYEKARRENSLWLKYEIPKPFVSNKDIFTIKHIRRADGYRTISLNTLKIKVNKVNPYDYVEIRIYVLNREISELRFWREEELLDVQVFKNQDLKGLYF